MIETFFEEYRTTFARFDREALLPLFALPIHVASATDGDVNVMVAGADVWPGVIDGLFSAYRTLRVVDAELLELDAVPVSDQLWSARVRWRLVREDRSAVYEFTAVYTVIEAAGALRVAAIAHDELPKLTAAMSAP